MRDWTQEEFDKCVKDARKRYDDALKYFQDWKSAAPDKKITLYICGWIGANWQESCPEDGRARCEQRDKCVEGGGGNACHDHFQEICRISSLKNKRKSMEADIAACEKKHSKQAPANIKQAPPVPTDPAPPKFTPKK